MRGFDGALLAKGGVLGVVMRLMVLLTMEMAMVLTETEKC
jgi:hypothetical protein